MSPLVSIIVPVYNCENRISIFHQSIIEQTFRDFEIIYVNDCSSDESLDLLRKIESQDKYVKVESHAENLGAGNARNSGLKMSRGKYLCFLDADDFINENYLDVLVSNLQLTDADIVVCNYNFISEANGEIISVSKYKPSEYTGKDSLKIFVENLFNPAPWNKIYRRELFFENNIEFPERIAHQDFATIPLVVERAKRIVVISDILYNYVQNSDGYSMTAKEIHTYSIFKAFEIIYNHFKLYSPDQLESDRFRQIVVGRFRYNLGQRWNTFTEEHLVKYITNFVAYYSSHEWEDHNIELVDKALLNLLKTSLIKDEYKFLIASLDQNWLNNYRKHYLDRLYNIDDSKKYNEYSKLNFEISEFDELVITHKKLYIEIESLKKSREEIQNHYSLVYEKMPTLWKKVGSFFRKIT
jgi:glycosyltransferase involved in cell wall biosynthesis